MDIIKHERESFTEMTEGYFMRPCKRFTCSLNLVIYIPIVEVKTPSQFRFPVQRKQVEMEVGGDGTGG